MISDLKAFIEANRQMGSSSLIAWTARHAGRPVWVVVANQERADAMGLKGVPHDWILTLHTLHKMTEPRTVLFDTCAVFASIPSSDVAQAVPAP